MRHILIVLFSLGFMYTTVGQKIDDHFVLSTWTSASEPFDRNHWSQKLEGYDSLGISEILVQASPDLIRQIVPLAKEKNIRVHAWMWTLNRPNDSTAMLHPDWYAVNRNGDHSLDVRAYVDYYQWLSPFHPDARAYIKGNAAAYFDIPDLASVHLDYVRYVDVILGRDLQPKYDLIQDREMPEFDYGYHPIGRQQFEQVFGYDPLQLAFPELSMEWKQFRLDAVSSLVNEIAAMAHESDMEISAAVFPFPTMSRRMVGQAWDDWHIDRCYPMLYHNFYQESVEWIGWCVAQNVRSVSFPIYAGIYMPGFQTDESFRKAILLAFDNGASGVSLFTADGLTKSQKQILIDLFKP